MNHCYSFIHPLRNWIVEKVGSGYKPPAELKKQDSLTAGDLVLLPIAVFAMVVMITAGHN